MSDSPNIDEMIRCRQAPGVHTFKPRVIENLTPEPVLVESEAQHRSLMKQANARYLGPEGHKDSVERALDNRAQQQRLAREAGEKPPKEKKNVTPGT